MPATADTASQALGSRSTRTPVALNTVSDRSPRATDHRSMTVGTVGSALSSVEGMVTSSTRVKASAGVHDPSPHPAISARSSSERANGSPPSASASSRSASRSKPSERSMAPLRRQVVRANERSRTSDTSRMAVGPTTSASTGPRWDGWVNGLTAEI